MAYALIIGVDQGRYGEDALFLPSRMAWKAGVVYRNLVLGGGLGCLCKVRTSGWLLKYAPNMGFVGRCWVCGEGIASLFSNV